MTASEIGRPESLARQRDRYELLEELPHATSGRLYRARDLAFGEMVSFKELGAGCDLPISERRQAQETVRRLQCLRHSHLVRVDCFDSAAGLLVTEWVRGISLLDLLRRRRELPVEDALRLLETLPATLDFLVREGVPIPQPLLGKLFLQVAENEPADLLVAQPVQHWPPFTLKLNALSFREVVSAPQHDDATHTFIPETRLSEGDSHSAPQALAHLLYELLGGRVRDVDAQHYSPLSALREAGNAILRQTLLVAPAADCQTFWQDLLDTQPGSPGARLSPPELAPPASRVLRIPEALLANAHRGTVLRLEPADASGIPIRLVAGPRFAIGRSPQQADFLARVLPENEGNIELTNRLSRVHARLEIGAESLLARDGNGHTPSLNGSSLDARPLLPEPPRALAPRSLLWLAEEYALELVRVLAEAARPLDISNLEKWSGPAEASSRGPRGAVVSLPAHGHAAARHAAWIFTEAGFGLDAGGQLIWDTRECGESPGAFHHHRGCFWLRNHALPAASVGIDATMLEPDAIAPLADRATVRLGPHTFIAHLE